MVINVALINKGLHNLSPSLRYIGAVCLLSHNVQSQAFSVTAIPSLTFQEIFSDNIRLANSGDEQGAFVTELSPSISISAQPGRSNINLFYRMQNLYNAGGSDDVKTFNQLQHRTNTTVIQNRVFLDTHSSISQQNLSNTQIARDNISGPGNRTNVMTYGISPTWTPQIGNYASGVLQFRFDSFESDSGSTSNQNAFSDTVTLSESIQITSGPEFKRVTWSLSHNNTDNIRSNSEDVSFQNSSGTVRTFLNKNFNIFSQVGYSDNNILSNNRNRNGLSYTFGGQWQPSRYYSIEAGGGNNSHITIDVWPMRRLNWRTTIRNNEIGLNTGETFDTAINYQTRRSTWSLTHTNDTTTIQDILLQQLNRTEDQFGNPITGLPETNDPSNPTLSNDVIVRKRWNFGTSFNTGKSTINANAFNETRDFQLSGDRQIVRGINATWNWQFERNTSAYIRPLWQETDRGTSGNDERFDFLIGVNRSIITGVNASLEVRHLNQTSSFNTNNFEENRATASLNMRY